MSNGWRTAALALMTGALLAATAAAPSAAARELDAPTLLVQHRFNINVLNNSLQTYNDYLLLLPDGTAYENLPKEGMKKVTADSLAAEAKDRPSDLGKWKREGAGGDGIETTFTRSSFDPQAQAPRDRVEVATYQKTGGGGWSKDGKQDRWNT